MRRLSHFLFLFSVFFLGPVILMVPGYTASFSAATDLPAPARNEMSPVVGKKLNLREAIELALRQNPNMRQTLKTYEASSARIGEIQSGFYPQLEADLTYTRATANFAPQPGLALPGGAGGESNTSYPNYNASLNFRQLLFDFGKLHSQVQSTRMEAESAGVDQKTTADSLILNVKQAYYGLLESLKIQEVNEETVHQMEKHLEQAEGFFKAGSKPKFDVTKARVDLTSATLNLIRAKNKVQVARITLNNAMGMPVDFQVDPEDSLAFKKEEMALETAQKLAIENRPELLSLRLKKKSAFYSLQYTKRQFYPTLTASGGYQYRNDDFPLINNWNVGATLAFPFFSGFQTVKQADEAQANVEVLSAQEEVQVQNVLLEVQQDYLNLTAAEEQIVTSELIVKQAEENLNLAEGRYKAGVGTALETTDAEVLLSNAKTSMVQSLFDYNVAQAQLEKAIGKISKD